MYDGCIARTGELDHRRRRIFSHRLPATTAVSLLASESITAECIANWRRIIAAQIRVPSMLMKIQVCFEHE